MDDADFLRCMVRELNAVLLRKLTPEARSIAVSLLALLQKDLREYNERQHGACNCRATFPKGDEQ